MDVLESTTEPILLRRSARENENLHHHHDEPPIFPDPGHEGFMIFGSALLWLLIPGCGFFYAGMATSRSALSMMTLSLYAVSIAGIQWFLFGYSLSFSLTSGNPLIGDFSKSFFNFPFKNNTFPTAPLITELSFCFYQGVTSCIPASLISGALAERARLIPFLFFMFLWNTFVYCPCAYWSLNPNGWSYKMGVLDFGGGAPVHVPAAAAAVAYSYLLGPRTGDRDGDKRPNSMHLVVTGTVFIWVGSFGYNAGSAFGATTQSITSCIVTNLSGSIGSITWSLLDYISTRKCSAFGFCAGAVVGLIVITPASGFVHPWAAIPFGIVGTLACRWGIAVKNGWRKFDDALDVFAMHGVAGVVGVLGAGIFSQRLYGGEEIGDGGMIEGNYVQILIQMADTLAGFTWSISISFLLLFIIDRIPGLKLRLDKVEEDGEGMDRSQFGVACWEELEDRMKELQVKKLNCVTSSSNVGEPMPHNYNGFVKKKEGEDIMNLPNIIHYDDEGEKRIVWQNYWQ